MLKRRPNSARTPANKREHRSVSYTEDADEKSHSTRGGNWVYSGRIVHVLPGGNTTVIITAVNLTHLYFFFSTALYSKIDSAKFCVALFIMQLQNIVLHI